MADSKGNLLCLEDWLFVYCLSRTIRPIFIYLHMICLTQKIFGFKELIRPEILPDCKMGAAIAHNRPKNAFAREFLRRFVTMNETWIHHYTERLFVKINDKVE